MLRCLGLVLLAVLLTPTAAMAHTSSVDTNPEHGARLEALPAEATITFSEPPKQVDVVLSTPDRKIEILSFRVDGPTVIVKLPARGPRGDYGLSYRVVSADGHPVSGSVTFTATTGPTATPRDPSTVAPATTPPVADDPTSAPASGLAMAAGAAMVALLAGALFWLTRR